MAGDWIKMRMDLFTHPKVIRITSALKADKLRTVGGLMSVWSLFDVHSIDGLLEGYTPEVIDSHLQWPGFAEQMIAVGWLENSKDGLLMPRFDNHNGQSAKRRAMDADRKRIARELSALDADDEKKRSGPEKRREEKKRKEIVDTPPEGVSDAVWSDFLQHRKAKRSPVTDTVVNGIQREADKAGVSLETALAECCARGWTGFKAVWYVQHQPKKSFAEQEAEFKRKQWEEMTGRSSAPANVIDMDIDFLGIAQ